MSILQNSPTLSGDEYGILSGNDPIAKPLAMAYFGGFFDAAEEGFNAVIQRLHTEYQPQPTLQARFDSNIPGKPDTGYCSTRSFCRVSP